jgi:signal transduction histidine kinase
VPSTTRGKTTGSTPGQGTAGHPREPRRLRLFEVATVVVAIVGLAVGFLPSAAGLSAELLDIAAWLPAVVIADLLPVTLWKPIEVTMSLPVLLAAGMVFPPPAAALLAFVGYTDLREIRREVPLLRGLFNRSNVALSVFAGSWLFHRTGGTLTEWPGAVGSAFLALAGDMIVNYALLFAGAHLLLARPLSQVIGDAYGRGRSVQFVLGYVCFGSMAILLSSVYAFAGNWGLVVFIIPVLVAHEMFSNGAALGVASVRIRHQERAFASLSDQMADERRDERLTMAAGLHDDVLPSLYKVHLMSQVIRQDLASGRLLDLDDDIPSLLEATDAANDAVRILIRDLRRSPLGLHGLPHTLRIFARQVEAEFGVKIDTEFQDVHGDPVSELLAYQIAHEAINNCVKHARGSRIRVALMKGDSDFRLVVQDEGPGFVPHAVDTTRHFGLQLMRERIELCGGTIAIDSSPGNGTTIAARFPTEPPTMFA